MDSRENKSTEKILYGFWLSPYMSLVAHVLKESNIAFRYERVSPFVGGTHTDNTKREIHSERFPALRIRTGPSCLRVRRSVGT